MTLDTVDPLSQIQRNIAGTVNVPLGLLDLVELTLKVGPLVEEEHARSFSAKSNGYFQPPQHGIQHSNQLQAPLAAGNLPEQHQRILKAEQIPSWKIERHPVYGDTMPRYYFDVINGQGPMRDDEGIDLPTKDAAPAAAARMLLDLASDEITYQQAANFKVRVRDERGIDVFIAKLSFSSEWISY